MKWLKIFSGIAIVLAALWGGAYLLDVLPKNDWRAFPSYITTLLVGMGGFALFATGMSSEN